MSEQPAITAKLKDSATYQLVLILTVALVGMLVMEQLGVGKCSEPYFSFTTMTLGYMLGRRAEASGRM